MSQATEEDKAKKSEWTKAQDGLLLSSATVFKDNPRAACLMTCVINKPCYEVKTSSARAQNAVLLITIDPAQIDSELRRRGLLSIQAPTPAVTTTTLPFMNPPPERPQPQNPKTGKRKRTFDTRPAPKPKLKGEYPADCVNTDLSDHRNYYKPCTHTGPCNSSCPCVKAKVMCEKYCNCDADCPRRWRGCNCAASGRACSHNSTCACVKWNRECDPDLCGTCGAAETLSPSNRYNEELAAVCCQNVALQRDVPRRTLLGVSGVSGLGLFIGENIKANQFLGEYKGEVVSHDEAERRGKLYDKRGVSFLFNLNQGTSSTCNYEARLYDIY